jgi:hypothetical protein
VSFVNPIPAMPIWMRGSNENCLKFIMIDLLFQWWIYCNKKTLPKRQGIPNINVAKICVVRRQRWWVFRVIQIKFTLMGNSLEGGATRCPTYIQFLIIGWMAMCYDRGDRKRGPTLRKSY